MQGRARDDFKNLRDGYFVAEEIKRNNTEIVGKWGISAECLLFLSKGESKEIGAYSPA